MAAVAVDLNQVAGKEGLANVLKFFVSPLTRDINDDGSPKEVKDLAQEVSELIKGIISWFNNIMSCVDRSWNLILKF